MYILSPDSSGTQSALNLLRVRQTLEYQKINGLWFRMEYRLIDPRQGGLELVRKQQCDKKMIWQIEEGQSGA